MQSVVELTATSAVSLVRLAPCCVPSTDNASDAPSDVARGVRRTRPQHAPSIAARQTQYLEPATHSSRQMASRQLAKW